MHYRDLEYLHEGSGRKRLIPSDENLWREIFGDIMSYAKFLSWKQGEPTHPKVLALRRALEIWEGARNRPGVHDQKLLKASNERIRVEISKEIAGVVGGKVPTPTQ